jgi:hypothetical protein
MRKKISINPLKKHRSDYPLPGRLNGKINAYFFLHMLVLFFFLLNFAFLTSGCGGTKLLKQYKEHAASEDYEWIVSKDLDCEKKSDLCSQLHLIRGNAHYSLAKQGKDEIQNYSLAADHLEKGIKFAEKWEVTAQRNQFYENLCESLRNWQDKLKGAESEAVGARFLAAAEEFYSLAPNNIASIYFVSKARMRKMQKQLLNVTDTNRGEICGKLKSILAVVEGGISLGGTTEQSLWNRYKTNYELLKSDISRAKNVSQCQN